MKFGITETPELRPCIVRDADGVIIPHILSGDTETGICICFTADEHGKLMLDSSGEAIATHIVVAKAPLSLHPVHPRT